MIRKQWVSDVRHFMQTARIGNDRPMSTPTKELLASSVKSFLRAWVDEELDHDFKVSYTTEELQKKQEEEAEAYADFVGASSGVNISWSRSYREPTPMSFMRLVRKE